MKKLYFFPYLFLFLFGLIGGIRISPSFSLPENVIQPAQSVKTAPRRLATLGNGQRSIMVVMVDQLDQASPNLEGIWLILYVPNQPQLTIMPVFPSNGPAGAELDAQILGSFRLQVKDNHPKLSKELQESLTNLGFWWSGYILIDDAGMQKAADGIASLAPVESAHQTSGQVFDESMPAFLQVTNPTNRRFLLLNQASRLQKMCQQAKLAEPSFTSVQAAIGDMIPAHLSLDFDPNQLVEELEWLFGHKNKLVCEVPVLDTQPVASH